MWEEEGITKAVAFHLDCGVCVGVPQAEKGGTVGTFCKGHFCCSLGISEWGLEVPCQSYFLCHAVFLLVSSSELEREPVDNLCWNDFWVVLEKWLELKGRFWAWPEHVQHQAPRDSQSQSGW